MAEKLQLSIVENDVAVLTFDDPEKGANVLSRDVLLEFQRHLDALDKRPDIVGLIIGSGKPGSFIAGADLREFAASLDAKPEAVIQTSQHGRRLFQRLSHSSFVTVCAIDGICVGGGAELASWCDYRIMTDDAKAVFGFPEVKLGLFPGWGGTVRAPRIAGLGNAVEMITGGESITGREAKDMGWLWDVVPADRLMASAIRLIRHEQNAKSYLVQRERLRKGVPTNETELAFLGATASAYIQSQTKGHYPAPLAALEVLLGGISLNEEAACQLEAESFAKLFGGPVNRALINVFFLQDRNKKDPGVPGEAKPRKVGRVSVLGAGIMGQGITAACVKRELPVSITDASPDALARGVTGVLEEVAYHKELKGPDVARMARFAPLVNGTVSDDELAASDLLIEAVVENPKVKKEIFARLEPKLSPAAILASNTSSIPINLLADGLARPEHFLGIHFFNPVRRMPLVEIIRGPKTADDAVATAVAFAKKIGKSPIVVNDCPGFLVNRLLTPYMNEAVQLLLDGVPLEKIEKVARRFGMPMGPFTLYDVVGLDTAVYAGRVLREAFPERFPESPLLPAMVDAKRLGQKTGRGFFVYGERAKQKGKPDPAFDELARQFIRTAEKIPDDQIENRLFLPMLLEATRAMEEGIARDVRDVDLALIYGIGFPPFKGGLFYWADSIGAPSILDRLEPLEPLGPRFAPTKWLMEVAGKQGRFYE